jgi:hypothetical protein
MEGNIFKELARFADHLDSIGLKKEADGLDSIIIKLSSPEFNLDDLIEDGKLTGEEIMYIGEQMRDNKDSSDPSEEKEVLEKWESIVTKIEDRKEELRELEDHEDEISTSISVLPIAWDEEEIRLRMRLKHEFGWPQEKIDKEQYRLRPSWAGY